MEKQENDKNIYEILKKLVDLECNNAKVEAVTFAKKGSRLVSNKVNDMQECIIEKAKEYGKKIEYVNDTPKLKSAIEANILRNYTLSLEKVNKQFDTKRKELLDCSMSERQKLYEKYMKQSYLKNQIENGKKAPEYFREMELKEEAKRAIEDGEYDKLSKIDKELQEISKKNPVTMYEKQEKEVRAEIAKIEEVCDVFKEEIKNCENERRQAIELIAGKKENLLQTSDEKYMLVYKNENFVQKAFRNIFNKINGSKKYTENVINVLTKKVRDIEYKSVPNLKNKLKNETMEIINKASTFKDEVVNLDIKENDSKTKKYTIKGLNSTIKGIKYIGNIPKKTVKAGQKSVRAIGDAGKQTYNAMIEKYRSSRMWTITKMEEKITKLESKEKQRKEKEETKEEQEER